VPLLRNAATVLLGLFASLAARSAEPASAYPRTFTDHDQVCIQRLDSRLCVVQSCRPSASGWDAAGPGAIVGAARDAPNPPDCVVGARSHDEAAGSGATVKNGRAVAPAGESEEAGVDSPIRSDVPAALNLSPPYGPGRETLHQAIVTLTRNQNRQGWSTAFKIVALGGWISTAVLLIDTAASGGNGSAQEAAGLSALGSAVAAAVFTGVAVALDNHSLRDAEGASPGSAP